MAYETYDNPLITRYASAEMAQLFSPQVRVTTWRRLWLALAESERELGLPITRAQIEDLRRHLDDIDWRFAEAREREVRHDVMAHIHAYAKVARRAAPIIHLGATSYDIVDNADLIIIRDALRLICRKLAAVIISLGDFARKYRSLPTLGWTHYQPAQPTTVGKRAALWAQDFALDLKEVERRESELAARGIVGATGTQASFLELLGGDRRKVERLNRLVCRKMGFARCLAVASQTYTRKIDTMILASLAGIGESAHKFATDVRLLAGRKEIEEPFEKKQIGSSAMAYKRNPMRCERICSLARWLMAQPLNSAFTHATQWLERTLDDSAGRRLYLPQAFLAADAILELCANVSAGLVVYPLVIRKA
ncbi:MAG: adenylosuccinate lyase, partial [Planctomycetota bacterium]|nr:adenylosuccinate lyase [Planctomycetota bacterium]